MNIGGHDIGVCSWSLQPKGISDLVAQVKEIGLSHVQLALGPLIGLDQKQKLQELVRLRGSGISLTGGMIAFPGEDYSTIDAIRRTGGFMPDDLWPQRKQLVEDAGRLGAELGLKSITTHVGFVPPRSEAGYAVIRSRVIEVAATLAGFGIDLLMETGQEPATELNEFLHDLGAANIHINFDPANMILYGAGDPIPAMRVLAGHIRHVHVKDGTASSEPGKQWGVEVPFGKGQVGATAFLKTLTEIGYTGPLAIEREAGSSRLADVRAAIDALIKASTTA
jgi:L-ribulose-5-phosphate 3-epimerase